MGWSAEQITGRLGREESDHTVGVETMYRFIDRPAVRREKLGRFLPRAKASRGRRYFERRREPIGGRRSIHERPQTAGSRDEFGHGEGDPMRFRPQRGNLLTGCERKTRFVLTAPLKTKTAAETGTAIIDVLGGLPRGARKTMTFDTGGEFGQHQHMEATLGMAPYFRDPHAPRQRGTIDNTNGIVRRDMPRKTDITNSAAHDIDAITRAVNSTPGKCLGYKTPAEAFLENLRRCT